MTKDEFSELLQKAMMGGIINTDLAKRIDKPLIKGLCNLAYSQVISNVYKNATKTENYSQFNQFVKRYEVDVKYDTVTDEYYSELPVVIIQLGQDDGIRSITPKKDLNYDFIYRDNTQGSTYNSQEVNKILTKPVFYVEGGNVRYVKDKWNKNFNDGVLIKLLPDLSAFDDDEEIGIPAENSFTTFEIIKKIIAEMPQSTNVVANTQKQI